ncbi:hypothetical protein MKX01_028760 [Papaver californicum]|nr:hypothetical protein MKX01_028760 [Papaver californicum]
MKSLRTAVVRCLSRCTIKPHLIKQTQQHQEQQLTPWCLSLISEHYIQVGLLFAKPPPSQPLASSVGDSKVISGTTIVDQLKVSLSQTLTHFLPLTGRFVTNRCHDPPSYSISIDYTNNNSSEGVAFIHAAAPVTVDEILSSIYVPPIVRSFFASYDNGDMTTINHDGHTIPLLSVQVTELVHGYFIGCSVNHAVVDGNSLYHFLSMWAEICRKKGIEIELLSRPPIIKGWSLKERQEEVDDDDHHGNNYNAVVNLPFSHPNEFIGRYPAPPLAERIFHFSAQSMSKLKTQANNECRTNKISAFQALSALVWRSLARARCLLEDQETSCMICIDDRWRLDPSLSKDYFGFGHTDESIRRWFSDWKKNPKISLLGPEYDQCTMLMGGSPRFDAYGCDFGWGKPMAVRSGWTFKFNGNVWAYPGRDSKGSVDLEICLSPTDMSILECDEEFMNAVTTKDALVAELK